ncbi:MAG: hypothetical protein J7639_30840 [Paenibacillaceae bacterium]|nr:hypothetical protein [Paenibacillaceae bacterium]
MSAISVNLMRDGVIAALEAALPDVDVLGEPAAESQPLPYCYAKLLEVRQAQERGNRFRRIHAFDVQYTEEAPSNESLHLVAEQLYETMLTIAVSGGTYRSSELKHRIVGNVLHFYASYVCHVVLQEATPTLMQTLEQEEGIKP